MLRDFPSGLTLAAVTGTLYALKMYLALLHWNFGDDACGLLVLVGIMLSATGFFGEFVAAARLNRRLLEASAEIDQRKRRFNESARARALRLNAYALASLDGTTATHSAMVAPEMAKVTPAFGFGFRLKVVGRILAVVERPTFADEPTVDVFAARVAHGQQPGLSITAWPTQSTCRSRRYSFSHSAANWPHGHCCPWAVHI